MIFTCLFILFTNFSNPHGPALLSGILVEAGLRPSNPHGPALVSGVLVEAGL